MEEKLNSDEKKFISTKEAAKLTGYTHDYIGQLARSGKVESKLVGRVRYVSQSSILDYREADGTKKNHSGKRANNKDKSWDEMLLGIGVLKNNDISPPEHIVTALAREVPIKKSNSYTFDRNVVKEDKKLDVEKEKKLNTIFSKETQDVTNTKSVRTPSPYLPVIRIPSLPALSTQLLRNTALFMTILSIVTGGYLFNGTQKADETYSKLSSIVHGIEESINTKQMTAQAVASLNTFTQIVPVMTLINNNSIELVVWDTYTKIETGTTGSIEENVIEENITSKYVITCNILDGLENTKIEVTEIMDGGESVLIDLPHKSEFE